MESMVVQHVSIPEPCPLFLARSFRCLLGLCASDRDDMLKRLDKMEKSLGTVLGRKVLILQNFSRSA